MRLLGVKFVDGSSEQFGLPDGAMAPVLEPIGWFYVQLADGAELALSADRVLWLTAYDDPVTREAGE